MDVAAARNDPAIAEQKARPALWRVKLYTRCKTAGTAMKNWKRTAKLNARVMVMRRTMGSVKSIFSGVRTVTRAMAENVTPL